MNDQILGESKEIKVSNSSQCLVQINSEYFKPLFHEIISDFIYKTSSAIPFKEGEIYFADYCARKLSKKLIKCLEESNHPPKSQM